MLILNLIYDIEADTNSAESALSSITTLLYHIYLLILHFVTWLYLCISIKVCNQTNVEDVQLET